MKRYLIPCLAAAFTLGLSACSNDNSTPPGTGYFRTVNAVADSTSMNVDLGNVGSLSSIPNNDASGVVTVPKGSYDATLKPTSNSSQDYKVTGVPIDTDNVTTVVAYGSVSGGTASGFKTQESISAPSNTANFAVQFVNGSYATSVAGTTLTFYIVQPGSTIAQSQANTVSFGQSPARVEFPIASAGYELVIQGPGGTTLYDSGTGAALLQNGANVLQIIAVDAASGSSGVSPLAVIVADNKGAHFALPPATASGG